MISFCSSSLLTFCSSYAAPLRAAALHNAAYCLQAAYAALMKLRSLFWIPPLLALNLGRFLQFLHGVKSLACAVPRQLPSFFLRAGLCSNFARAFFNKT